ncbi:MAG: hypothetical protein RL226_531 [Bacteroidota bacterium]
MKSSVLLIIAAASFVILGSASGCNEVKQAVSTDGKAGVAEEEIDQPTSMSNNENSRVRISTSYGDMIVKLYDETPEHRDNFLKLVDEGFYNDLVFHRVINNFMIQGGDPDSRGAAPNARLGMGGPGYTIPAEFNDRFIHKKGALAAARQGDQVNPQRRSSGSQFYIVHGTPVQEAMLLNMEARRNYGKDSTAQFHYTPEEITAYATQGGTPHLDGEYTVFGEIVEGLNIVDSIAGVPVRSGDNRPLTDVLIKMERVKQ